MLISNVRKIVLSSVKPNSISFFNYVLTNQSDQPIKIKTPVGVSCGCTVPNLERDIIPPHETSKLTAKFDSTGKGGVQNKKIWIKYDDQQGIEQMLTLEFTAIINAKDESNGN